MNKFRKFFVFAMLLSVTAFFASCGNDDEGGADTDTPGEDLTITDNGEGTGTTTWTAGNTYLLDGFVYVNDGQTLTIEPGTVIKGKSGQGETASALIVARGGRIIAEGTADAPIIFTAEADLLNGNLGTTQGLWGGIIMLGNAGLNSAPGESAIEGIPTSETRGLYGGTSDNDNSGVLKYVSIRHGGTDIGAGNEINGLTLGGVGSGTTIEYVEIFANKDDGIEFFGGTVNTKYVISAYCGDDAVDYDEGYRGKNQFTFVYQNTGDGDRGGEHDGGTDPEDGNPYATPMFVNCTYVGGGTDGKRTITFRDNAGGQYHNSVFANFTRGIDVEFLASGESSYKRFEAGQLILANNTFSNVAGNDASAVFTIGTVEGKEPAEAELTAAVSAIQAHFSGQGNAVDAEFITRSNVVPAAAGGAVSNPGDSFFDAANYRGAFAPGSTPWFNGWARVADEF